MASQQIYTRFPPEPNGFLHIGHLKAMLYDFEKHENAKCYLRFDDTNPDKESQLFVDGIISDVSWMNFTPYKITYTSDYFEILYTYAIKLIKNGLAYMDFSTDEEIKNGRYLGTESKYRNMDIEYHLNEFDKMKNGIYGENICILRLKIDMNHSNHVMRDPIAYRVKKTPHYKTKDTWCIYPSYDYSHGIIDAIENITYSYCTSEFYIRRDLYYWSILKLNDLGENLIPAEVIEFGKLTIENNILSKRNITNLVNNNLVNGYDDPRLLTLRGLRNRGYTPTILKEIANLGTLNRQDQVLSNGIVYYYLRQELNENAKRVFGVVEPMLLEISNFDEYYPEQYFECEHPTYPPKHKDNNEKHYTTLTKQIYIERTDFREIDDPNYYRLAPNKTIRLRYGPFIEYVSHEPTKIICRIVNPINPKKIKGIIHWVSADCTYSESVKYVLFSDILKDGKFNEDNQVVHNGYIEKYAHDLSETVQMERVGYFKKHEKDDNGVNVFIRTVELFGTDDYKKKLKY